MFDGERLTLARHLAGLRKNALAEAIGKTPTAIASYENGTKRPSGGTVAQLCLALGVEPEFFMAGLPRFASSHGSPHFRSLRSTTQVARDQAYALGQLAVSVAATLERHVELPAVDVPRLNVSLDSSLDDAQHAARELRELWGITSGPLSHTIRLMEHHGILVLFSAAQTSSVDAYSFDNSHRPVVLLNPVKDDYYRQRFDVAHELGHLVMHADSEPGGRVIEEQAHRFAAELLMPAEQIVDLLPTRADWRLLGRLKETWGVSLQALLFRARQLNVMSDVTYRNAMATVSARGWRRREPGASMTVEQPSLLSRAVELLESEGVAGLRIAGEARVPLELFWLVTSRTPLMSAVDQDGDAPSTATGTVSLLTAPHP
ncbi:XRE family transcriptional regulator [Kineococcus rubinsiae]|uniref:XRE family transcriptional regulator n=1 Tax=Kineococcus rubinsiae TaxID=2609562 RepID=UPI001430C82E|nr:XRE family transcriptional regulator [Kineococcus rubinsiae]NIZ90138.1 ImmA/IrrE family metallo-endopeptidase [Kineococcus rubinsiae]